MNYCFQLKGVNKTINFNKNKINITNSESKLESLKKAADIHRRTRIDIQNIIQPGIKLSTLEKNITEKIKYYTNNKGINGGVAFPPSLSISNCIAHFTPYKDIDRTLTCKDNIKIDIGVHVNGWMIDSAFTVYFNPELDLLHKVAKEATYLGCKNIAIDTNISDWAEEINEFITSHEMLYKKKIYTIKNIKNVGGHNILQNNIHGGMFIPAYPTNSNLRFKEGVYAIEPFCSIIDDKYNLNYNEITNYKLDKVKTDNDKKIYSIFNSYIFTRKYIDNYNIKNFNNKNLIKYPPLYSKFKDDFSAQFEHTVYLNDNNKIILSKYNDY